MKKINPELHRRLRQTEHNIVLGFKMIRTDGFLLGFTSSDMPFVYDGLKYEPSNALSGMAAQSKSNLSVDNSSVLALISDDITKWDLQAGVWDNCKVEMFWISPTEPELGIVPIRGGKIGEIKTNDITFEAELRAIMQRLQQPYGDFYTLECYATFGDNKCKIAITADQWVADKRYIAKAGADAGIGSYVKPSVPNGYWYQCVKARGGTGGNAAQQTSGVKSISQQIKEPPAGLDWSTWTTAEKNAMNTGGLAAMAVLFGRMEQAASGQYQIGTNPTSGEKWFFAGLGNSNASVTQEGAVNQGNGSSYYNVSVNSSGQLVDSGAYLTPTKEGEVPLSAPPGVQPLTIINGSAKVIYAMGTSGPTEPVWPTTLGAEVDDNQLTWKAIRHRSTTGTVSAIFSRIEFIDNNRQEPSDYWTYGRLVWLSGNNKGLKVEIRKYTIGSGYGGFILLEKMPGEIAPGDQYEISIGCAKTRTACKAYDNIHNYRGFPDMPTEERALATPNITARGTAKEEDSGGS